MEFRKQEAPYCIQIELALGCNLQCRFCGINGMQDSPGKGLQFMSLETAEVVAKRIAESGWNPRLEFARRGEPTMNPHYAEIIAIFRKHNPRLQIMMTSNGGGLLRAPGPHARIEALFNAGLNILVLDDYQTVRIVPKIRESVAQRNSETYKVFEYPAQPEANPHRRYPQGTRFVAFTQDISVATAGTHSTLNNHAGHGAPLREYNKRCAKPFRELGVNFDGSIDLCCIDWISEYRIGTLHESSLEGLWQHERMNAARQYLYRGERTALRPCHGCDHPSHRVGLLPDPLGKAELPVPSEWSAGVVAAALADGPVVPPTDLARERMAAVIRPHTRVKWGLAP